jgi:plasmid stability protein
MVAGLVAETRALTSITIEDMPAHLLARLRQRAAADRCSLNEEIICLVEMALHGEQTGSSVQEQIARQTAAWSELTGHWQADVDVDAEIKAIYATRTAGRPVGL